MLGEIQFVMVNGFINERPIPLVGFVGENDARQIKVVTFDDMSTVSVTELVIGDIEAGIFETEQKTIPVFDRLSGAYVDRTQTTLSIYLNEEMLGDAGLKFLQLVMYNETGEIVKKTNQFIVRVGDSNTPVYYAPETRTVKTLETYVKEITEEAIKLAFGLQEEVTSSSDFVNKKALYVYKGNEEDYQNGYWYYYDDTQKRWLPGGPYKNPTDEVLRLLTQKQDALTFDSTPTEDSQNPVTSDGVFRALAGHQITMDEFPINGSTNPVTSDGLYRKFGEVDAQHQSLSTRVGRIQEEQTELANGVQQNTANISQNAANISSQVATIAEHQTSISENADAIEEVRGIANTASNKADAVDDRLNNIIVESGTSDAETIAARTNTNTGITYTTLGQRLDEENSEIKEDLSPAYWLAREKRIANNLLTDGIDNLLPLSALVYKNGTASEANYGTSGARYLINLGDFKKCHVRFKYRHTAFHPHNGTNVFVSLASLGKNNALHIKDLFQSITVQSGQIYQNTGHYPANKDSGTTLTLNPLYKKPLIGENAIIVSYIGDETISANTAIDAVISDTGITFKLNGTVVGTVALNASDSIQSLADAISSVNGFACTVKNGNGTVADLMFPMATITMIDSVSRNDTTVYGTKQIMIPFKVDDSWHTVEFIVNKEAQEAFVAYDGYTGRVGFSTANALTDGMLAIGGNYTTNSGIEVKDLVIDINTYADCELLYGKITNASTTNTRQLISDINPRLMIFEGHGILAGTEQEAQEAYQASGSNTSNEAMQISIERLNIVFSELKKRGYIPITMQDVIAWKKGIINLPKRCYLCVFDDYRLENYLDYDKRTPFVKNDVKATLSMISNYKALTDTIECNGESYTVSDALDIVSKAGWFTASHTNNHRNISQYTANELALLLKDDVLSCDNHKMNGQVIVYPFGNVSATSLKVVANSDFTLGVSIVEEYYNCKASNDYRLTRTELGTRATLDRVLSPFI